MIVPVWYPDVVADMLTEHWQRRYLAAGDSWFSIGGWTGNLLQAIDDPQTLIVSTAYPGDELPQIGGHAFARLLRPSEGVPHWDAVLVSGGGNDLLGNCMRFIRADPDNPVKREQLLAALDDIERQIERIVRTAQAAQPGVPVVVHTYDYPPVERRWWWWHAGPWVAPVFSAARIDRARWGALVHMLVDMLADRLIRVAARWPQLVVVDTRNRLRRTDWRNEIHPSVAGYAAHAHVWQRALANLNPTHRSLA